jgi:hypothetical protein
VYQKNYFVPKISGTYAETLEAYGLATILNEILIINKIPKPKIKIQDIGSFYAIYSRDEITEEMVRKTTYFDAIPYIKIKKDSSDKLPNNFIDFDTEEKIYENFNKFKQALQNFSPKDRKKAIEEYENKPRFDFDILSNIAENPLSGYLSSFNNVYLNRDYYSYFLDQILYLYGSPLNSEEDVNKNFKTAQKNGKFHNIKEVNKVQLFNPSCGKGVNSEKSNSIYLKNVKGYWFKEYLKMIGCYQSMYITKIKVDNKRWDSKIYVIEPKSIELSQLNTIYKKFKPTVKGISSIKLDILSILKYSKILIENLEEYQEKKTHFSKILKPQHFIKGFHISYFKKLSKFTSSVSNIGFLSLPEFIEISSYDEAQFWINLLEDHTKIINKIKEDIGSNVELLDRYRQFLSSGLISEFFFFNIDYNELLIHDIGLPNESRRKMWLEPFSLNLMEGFLLRINKDFRNILENEGFRNVAKAIRNSTISEQYRKIKNKQQFDVHYGMAQDLKRKSPYKEELVTYIAEFISQYNSETARFAEKNPDMARVGKVRATIKTEDLEELIGLIEDYGPDLVGKLLCAYGYSLNRTEAQEESQTN